MSGIFILFLPETLNSKLPDTIEDAENVGAKKNDYAPVELKTMKVWSIFVMFFFFFKFPAEMFVISMSVTYLILGKNKYLTTL